MAFFTNHTFITGMQCQPNTALMRKFTEFGQALLLLRHSQIGDKLPDVEEALKASITLQRRNSALKRGGTFPSPEIDNEREAVVTEFEERLLSFYKLWICFHKVQSFPEPDKFELATFKDIFKKEKDIDISSDLWGVEEDLALIFPKRSQPLDKLGGFVVRQLYKWQENTKFQYVIAHLPGFIRRRILLPDLENQDGRPIMALDLDRSVINKYIRWLVIVVAPTINVASMCALYAIPSIWARLGIVWIFSFLLSTTTQLMTNEYNSAFVFSITSAFCAVLVVFIGSAPS